MKVAFRVDASVEIGSGHVMRCLTLADYLKKAGATCYFICREHDGHMASHICSREHEVFLLPNPLDLVESGHLTHAAWLGCEQSVDADETLQSIVELGVEWMVVDHYGLDREWETIFRERGMRLLVIDDLADRDHDCDVLLDQTFRRDAAAYETRVSKDCIVLTGTDYALLRPEFVETRTRSLERRCTAGLKEMLINLGGVDKDNFTGDVLACLADMSLPPDLEITVVLGPLSPWVGAVKRAANDLTCNVQVIVGSNEIASLMARADLAIGAAGSTSWERCALGLPTIQIVIADNQRAIAENLAAAGAIKLISTVSDLPLFIATATSWMDDVSRVCREIVDGKGVGRVAIHMETTACKSVF